MAETLTNVLTNVSEFVDQAFGWVTVASDKIIDNPILFIFAVAVPLVGLGVGLFRRLAGNL